MTAEQRKTAENQGAQFSTEAGRDARKTRKTAGKRAGQEKGELPKTAAPKIRLIRDGAFYFTSTERIVTGVTGTSLWPLRYPVRTRLILSTTSMPLVTRPKTV